MNSEENFSHLVLVRHGQSEWNLQKKFTGWVDVDLTPEGKLEACNLLIAWGVSILDSTDCIF